MNETYTSYTNPIQPYAFLTITPLGLICGYAVERMRMRVGAKIYGREKGEREGARVCNREGDVEGIRSSG